MNPPLVRSLVLQRARHLPRLSLLALVVLAIGLTACGHDAPATPAVGVNIALAAFAPPTAAPTFSPPPTATIPPPPTLLPTRQAPVATPVLAQRSDFLGAPTKPPPIVRPSQPMSVVISSHASKISQLIGDFDSEQKKPTDNLTFARYKLAATDLGVPFRHNGRTFILFGDTIGARGGDAIAYTTDTTPEKGLKLDFVHDNTGTYKPITIPGISQGDFEVPTEGVSVGGRMYVYHTTDASSDADLIRNGGYKMGRSVLAVSDDDGQTFQYLYDVSRRYFINISTVKVDSAAWPGLPSNQREGLLMFGSGVYRRSDAYLAFQPSAGINSRASLRYWAGLDIQGAPIWSQSEDAAQPLFNQPCIGEFSVTYNQFIRKWIMLYNCDAAQTRGIVMRTADVPWGPWSQPQVLFRPWEDGGYCQFIHTSWLFQRCDQVSAPGQENVWGGEYGPYQYSDYAIGDNSSTTIYFNMSTWNPYTVVLMQASLRLEYK